MSRSFPYMGNEMNSLFELHTSIWVDIRHTQIVEYSSCLPLHAEKMISFKTGRECIETVFNLLKWTCAISYLVMITPLFA